VEHVVLGGAFFGAKQTVLRIVAPLGRKRRGDPMSIARRWRKEHGTDMQTVLQRDA
jgi:hypothetical protein